MLKVILKTRWVMIGNTCFKYPLQAYMRHEYHRRRILAWCLWSKHLTSQRHLKFLMDRQIPWSSFGLIRLEIKSLMLTPSQEFRTLQLHFKLNVMRGAMAAWEQDKWGAASTNISSTILECLIIVPLQAHKCSYPYNKATLESIILILQQWQKDHMSHNSNKVYVYDVNYTCMYSNVLHWVFNYCTVLSSLHWIRRLWHLCLCAMGSFRNKVFLFRKSATNTKTLPGKVFLYCLSITIALPSPSTLP